MNTSIFICPFEWFAWNIQFFGAEGDFQSKEWYYWTSLAPYSPYLASADY
jgi:hypothetical protein